MNKKCKKCLVKKDINEFSKRFLSKDGLDLYCKNCKKIMLKEWQLTDKATQIKRKSDKNWYLNNKDRKMHSNANWKQKNTERVKLWYREYKQNREKKDICFKIANRLRTRLWYALRAKKINTKTNFSKNLGCSVLDLKLYLENLFQPGMTWDNYGEWEIDHIKPIHKFDLTDPEELKEACRYTNLQPLWAKDHKNKTKQDLKKT